MARSLGLRTTAGIWDIVSHSHFSMATWMLVTLLAIWVGAAARNWRRFLFQPLMRGVIVGPIIGVAIYLAWCQFPEVRYLDPTLALLFAAGAALIAVPPVPPLAGLRPRSSAGAVPPVPPLADLRPRSSAGKGAGGTRVTASTLAAAAFALVAVFILPTYEDAALLAAGAAVAMIGLLSLWAGQRWPAPTRRITATAGACAAMALLAMVYVNANWASTEYTYRTEDVWDEAYPELAEAWAYVRRKTRGGSTIAYTNTCLVYPLFGFDWGHDVIYAPVRRGITTLQDLPKVDQPVPGEAMVELVVAPLMQHADRDIWLANLRRARADYLFIAKQSRGLLAVELQFAEQEPRRFKKVFDNRLAAVYEINNR